MFEWNRDSLTVSICLNMQRHATANTIANSMEKKMFITTHLLIALRKANFGWKIDCNADILAEWQSFVELGQSFPENVDQIYLEMRFLYRECIKLPMIIRQFWEIVRVCSNFEEKCLHRSCNCVEVE